MKIRKEYPLIIDSFFDADRVTVAAGAAEAALPVAIVGATIQGRPNNPVVIGGQETYAAASGRAMELHNEYPRAIVCVIRDGVSFDHSAHKDEQTSALIAIELVLPDGAKMSDRTEIIHLPLNAAKAIWAGKGGLGIGEALMANPPPKFDILDWPERLKVENGFNPQDWQATYPGTPRAQLIKSALGPLLWQVKDHFFNAARMRTIDLTDGTEPAYETTVGPFDIRLPVRTTNKVPRASFDLMSPRALNANADERLATALATLAPKATTVVVGLEGRGAIFARLFAKALNVPLVYFFREKESPMGAPEDGLGYNHHWDTDGPEKLFVSQDTVGRLNGTHVILVDDLITDGRRQWAGGVLAEQQGARTVTYMAAFQEGERDQALLDAEDVIVLGVIPRPVPEVTEA